MLTAKCPTCGHQSDTDASCPACAHTNGNGAFTRSQHTPPAEAANWVIERPSLVMLEEARRTFDEAEYLAGVREIEASGGVPIDDLIAEIKREINGRV